MNPNPKPLSKTLQFEEVDDHRALFCPNYTECLDTAERNRWASFTCSNCEFFLKGKKEEVAGNESHLIGFWQRAFGARFVVRHDGDHRDRAAGGDKARGADQ